MDRWRGRVAVVTGASAGIGAAISLDLVKAGMIVVAVARRQERLEELRQRLDSVELRNKFHPYKCDITDENAVKELFNWVDKTLGGLHVIVNNAGVLRTMELLGENNTNDARLTVDTNVMAVLFCTREAFRIMRSHGVDDGHIVIINSVAGHQTVNLGLEFPSFNIYPATKHAITSMVEVYRQELLKYKTKIRITSISPGGVDTEIFPTEVDNLVRGNMPMLKPEDVSSAVLYAISTPPHVQIHEMIIKPIGELV